jgi:hypothetical protein
VNELITNLLKGIIAQQRLPAMAIKKRPILSIDFALNRKASNIAPIRIMIKGLKKSGFGPGTKNIKIAAPNTVKLPANFIFDIEATEARIKTKNNPCFPGSCIGTLMACCTKAAKTPAKNKKDISAIIALVLFGNRLDITL